MASGAAAAALLAGFALQTPVPIEVRVAPPSGLTLAGAQVAVLCRDARGGWTGEDVWRPFDAARPFIAAVAGARCRALLRSGGLSTYVATPEVVWARRDVPLAFGTARLRTVRAPASDAPVAWVGAEAPVDCAVSANGARCLFLPAGEAGVMVSTDGSRVRYVLVAGGESGDPSAAWRTAVWARMVRVRVSAQITAAVTALRPALSHGAGYLREAVPSEAARVYPLASGVFWIAGGQELDARLELRAAGAATMRIPLSAIRGPSVSPLYLSLAPEEAIDGDVRSRGALLEGARVMIARLLEKPPSADTDDEPPMETIAEVSTGADGTFRVGGLAHEAHELIVIHPSRGRARLIVTAPAHRRVLLTPRATLRGRVLRDGVPTPGAAIVVLPAFEVVGAARNPLMLMSEAAQTGSDGRFETALPDEGRSTLTVTYEGAAIRIELGDVAAASGLLDLGDINLPSPIDVDVLLDLPPACTVKSAGPFGEPGLSIVPLVSTAPGRWRFRAPLAGRWMIEGACGGREIALEPALVEVVRGHSTPVLIRPRR
jgi:hypothetical protein